jgi:hypothetical protein
MTLSFQIKFKSMYVCFYDSTLTDINLKKCLLFFQSIMRREILISSSSCDLYIFNRSIQTIQTIHKNLGINFIV